VPPQQEPQHDSLRYIPQEEEPFEVEIVSPEGQDASTEEHHQLQLNDENNNVNNINHDDKNHDNNNENDTVNDNDDEDDEDYTPFGDVENEKMYNDADELTTFGNEALIPTGRLKDLLGHIRITTAPKFKIKRIPPRGREEFIWPEI
jgi:hypothetical protein